MDGLDELRRRARQAAARVMSNGSGSHFVMMVTGSREYENGPRLRAMCEAVRGAVAPLKLCGVSGGAVGTDRLFKGWCERVGVEHINDPADWKAHRKAAGPIRNQHMIDTYHPDFYLAIAMQPGSGTQDCVEKAKLAGIIGYVDGPDISRDRIRLESGQIVQHHRLDLCTGWCSIHNPSPHHMRNWRRVWRDDRGMMERTCRHGVGHPDPDDLAYKARSAGEEALFFWEGIHGCDGCCSVNYIEGEAVVDRR